MGGQQDADPGVPLLPDHVPHQQAAVHVETGGGLVEERHLGPTDEGQGEGQALLLAPRQAAGRGLALVLQPHPPEQGGGVGRVVVVGREEIEDLGGADAGVEATLLEHHADAADHGGVVGQGVVTQDPDGARRRPAEALEGLDGGGLARPVRPQEGDHLARFGGERHPVHGHHVAVGDAQVPDLDRRRFAHDRTLPTGPGTGAGRKARVRGVGGGTFPAVIDVRLIRSDPDAVKAALGRRGEDLTPIDRVIELDRRQRDLTQERDEIRHQVKALSKEVGGLREAGETEQAEALQAESRALGEREAALAEEADARAEEVRADPPPRPQPAVARRPRRGE